MVAGAIAKAKKVPHPLRILGLDGSESGVCLINAVTCNFDSGFPKKEGKDGKVEGG